MRGQCRHIFIAPDVDEVVVTYYDDHLSGAYFKISNLLLWLFFVYKGLVNWIRPLPGHFWDLQEPFAIAIAL